MSEELEIKIIKVRDSNQTYIARCQGKTASCTASPKFAAEAVAQKIFGGKAHHLERDGDDYHWKAINVSK